MRGRGPQDLERQVQRTGWAQSHCPEDYPPTGILPLWLTRPQLPCVGSPREQWVTLSFGLSMLVQKSKAQAVVNRSNSIWNAFYMCVCVVCSWQEAYLPNYVSLRLLLKLVCIPQAHTTDSRGKAALKWKGKVCLGLSVWKDTNLDIAM